MMKPYAWSKAIERKRDCDGAIIYSAAPPRRYQEVVDIAEAAIEASGEDYNVYVPIINTLVDGRRARRT
jgi:non-specific serine/threonine protein kinase